jgi:hypothetical protein
VAKRQKSNHCPCRELSPCRPAHSLVLLLTSNKVKVKLSLCFNWAPRRGGVLWEWRYSSTHSLTSALDGGELSASRPGNFIPRERASGAHWIGGWVGPRVVLDAVVKRKIPSPHRESNRRTPIVQPVAQRYTDWAITALPYLKYKLQFQMKLYILCHVDCMSHFFFMKFQFQLELHINWGLCWAMFQRTGVS